MLKIQASRVASFLLVFAAVNCGGSKGKKSPGVVDPQPKSFYDESTFIKVDGIEQLRSQYSGNVSLQLSLSGSSAQKVENVGFKCSVTKSGSSDDQGKALECASGSLTLNLDELDARQLLMVTAVDGNNQVAATRAIEFCAGKSCSQTVSQTQGEKNGDGSSNIPVAGSDKPVPPQTPRVPVTTGIPGGGVVGLPPGVPLMGTVFNEPIGVPTVKLNIGRFWTMFLPPRYHIISTASNKTFEGPSTIEYAQVMDDIFTRSPYCATGSHENGRIATISDGMGMPFSYCVRYYNTEAQFRTAAGFDRGINSIEFSSPVVDPLTYERFYFSAKEARDPDFPDGGSGTPPLSRFENFCAAAYNRGEVPMEIINSWTNSPMDARPVEVRWCNTNISGFEASLDVWVVGFRYAETDGASNNGAQAEVEMVYVASAEGPLGTVSAPIFLSGAAFRVRAMLMQTGLNAPFSVYVN